MKRLQLIWLISFCICMIHTIVPLHAQGNQVELIMENGTTLKGYAKFFTKSLSFRQGKGEPSKRYKMTDFETIHMYSEGDLVKTYKKVKVTNRKKPEMLVQMVEGYVGLFFIEQQIYSTGYGAGLGVNGNAGQSFGGNFYTYKKLFLKKEGEKEAIHLDTNSPFKKNFESAAAAYFKDCPQLVDKIQKREYTKKQLKEIVEFYNNHCIK